MRLFFAFWPDGGARARIAEAAASLGLAEQARRVPPENYHVTLAFVGEVAPPQLAVLQQSGGLLRGSDCTMLFRKCEYWEEPRVVAAVAEETPAAMLELCTLLHRALALEPTLPRAHVTLARKVMQAPVLQAMSPFQWNAQSVSLVRSDTSRTGSVYTVVDTWPLLDKIPKP